MIGTVLGAAFCLLTPVLAGALGWRALGGSGRRALDAAAALVVGPGLVAVQMLVYHALGVPFALPWLALPWYVALGVALVLARRRAAERGYRAPLSAPVLVQGVLLVLLTVGTAVRAFAVPIHDGDEVNNFALFARVFGTLGSLAPERLVALNEPGHVEYPHLVALNQAWLFAFDPDTAPWTARGIEVLALLAFLLAAARVCGGHGWTGTAAFVLCAASPAVLRFAIGFADVRLLATFVLLGHAARDVAARRDPGAPMRLALLAGTAALTKNEGLAVAAVAVAVLAFWVARRARSWLGVAAVAVGAGLCAVWPILRWRFGLHTPYVDHALDLPLSLLVDQAPRVVMFLAGEMFPLAPDRIAVAGVFWWCALPAAVFASRAAHARWLLLAWLAHAGLYLYVLGIARRGDLDALLGTAGPRLLLHTMAWPVLLLGRLVEAGRPQDDEGVTPGSASGQPG